MASANYILKHLKVEMCGHVNKRQTALRIKQFKERKTIYSLKNKSIEIH